MVGFGMRIKGRIEAMDEDSECVRVKVKVETAQRWGEYLYPEEWNWARK